MKKILSSVCVVLLSIPLIPLKTFASDDAGYFIVTAYYSPLPNQKYYYTGDYESEIKLNGNGTNGASGKEVFSGMLAAPKTYEFGTKIYLEGLGIGEVSDRGGAIVSAGNRGNEYDRIDVWVGYGDEGLKRALYWGKRTIKGYVVHSSQPVTLDYTKIPNPDWTLNSLKPAKPKNEVFDYSLGKGTDSEKVKKLQEFFKELGLYSGEISGIYNNEIIDIVYDFQIENGIIKPGENGAGYWGKLTREAFEKAYLNGDFSSSVVQDEKNDDEIDAVIEVSMEDKDYGFLIDSETISVSNAMMISSEGHNVDLSVFDYSLAKGADAEKVKNLQIVLAEMGFYDGEISGNYNDVMDTIFDFQVEKGILKSVYDVGAGAFGPKTREILKGEYLSFLDRKAEEERLNQEQERKRLEEEEKLQELKTKFEEIQKVAISKAEKEIESIKGIEFGETSARVREFQLLLKKLGYFEEKDTAIFGEKTRDALLNFQADNSIILHKDDEKAGVVEEETIKAFVSILAKGYLKEELEKFPELEKFENI